MSISIGKKEGGGTQNYYSQPYITNTGYSTISGHTASLDPSIRALQDAASQNYASIYGDIGNAAGRFLGQSGGLRTSALSGYQDLLNRYTGNQSDYLQSVLRPVTQQYGTLRAQTQQDLGRRGLGGSSFATAQMSDLARQQGIAESDVTAQAKQQQFGFESNLLNQSLQFQNSLNTQELQALTNAAQQRATVTGESLDVAKARLLQELGVFGLGTQGAGAQQGYQNNFGLDLKPKF